MRFGIGGVAIPLTLLAPVATPGLSKAPVSMLDAREYADATCLTQQANPYLKDQGFRWAEVIVQGRGADLDRLRPIASATKVEMSKRPMLVVSDEESTARSKDLPIAYCNEVSTAARVTAAIRAVVSGGTQRRQR